MDWPISYYLLLLAGVCWLVGASCLVVLKLRRKKVTEEQRVDAAKNKRLMEALVATEGWKILAAIADSQVKNRTNQVLLQPTEAPLSQEYMKGEIQGISLFRDIPVKLIEESSAILRAYEIQEGTDA